MVEFIVVFIACWLCFFGVLGSIVAMEEMKERRKNYDAGTHDYYGNKLDE
jgi:hypothetical protein